MALNYYEGWTVAELLAERKRVQQRLSSGSLTEVGSTGVRSVKQYELKPDAVLENIAWSLFIIDPATYPYSGRESRTVAVVYG